MLDQNHIQALVIACRGEISLYDGAEVSILDKAEMSVYDRAEISTHDRQL